jgi:hypothetical protein
MPYTIKATVNGEMIERTRAKAWDAKDAARKITAEHKVEAEVIDNDGNVVIVTTPVEGRYFHPFERVETPRFAAPSIPGYRPAYTRKAIPAVVYRSLNNDGWMVWDGRTGATEWAKNTKDACALTKAMRYGYMIGAEPESITEPVIIDDTEAPIMDMINEGGPIAE